MSHELNQLRKFVSPEIIFGAGSRHNVAVTAYLSKWVACSPPGAALRSPAIEFDVGYTGVAIAKG